MNSFSYLNFWSGRTSRREIRKLIWDRLFWRIKRVKAARHGSKIHTHSFLFDDDDDDTERSIATTTAAAPYCALSLHSQNRFNYLSRQNSNNNYPNQFARQSSLFDCCGFTVDLSRKHSAQSSNGDVTSRRATVCKSSTNTTTNNNTNSPKKSRAYSHSSISLSSFDRNLRQQQLVSSRLSDDNNNQLTNRRRTATAVHCLRYLPSSTRTSIADHSFTFNTDSLPTRRSISEEKERSSIETLPLTISKESRPTTTGVQNVILNSIKDITDSNILEKNPIKERQLSAYIVETC